MSVPVATLARSPLAAAELAAALPASVLVEPDEVPALTAELPVLVLVVLSLLLAAREPRTPPRTAPMMTSARTGSPIVNHLDLRFGLGA